MALDMKGIHQYTELDAEATFSELLNLGMASVSDKLKFFSGTAAQRVLLDPAPDGAWWQDTDTGNRIWRGIGGVWEQFSATTGTITLASGVTNNGSHTLRKSAEGIVTVNIRVARAAGYNSAGIHLVTLPAGFRPTSLVQELGFLSGLPLALDVNTDGTIKVTVGRPEGGSVALNVSFYAA